MTKHVTVPTKPTPEMRRAGTYGLDTATSDKDQIVENIYMLMLSAAPQEPGGELLDPEMPTQELRLHMGELTANEVRVARAAIGWANSQASQPRTAEIDFRNEMTTFLAREIPDGEVYSHVRLFNKFVDHLEAARAQMGAKK